MRPVLFIPSNSENVKPNLDYNCLLTPIQSGPIERTSHHSILLPFW